MGILTEQEAKAILDKVIKLSKADECSAQLTGSITGNIRYALNSVSTSGIVEDLQLAVQVAYGKRVGTATINEFDDASLAKVVQRAEELAKLAPENPEFMPAIDKQTYKPSETYNAKTAAITPEYRANTAAASIEPCKKDKLVAAGFLTDAQGFFAMANSKGNFAYQKSASIDFTCTVRTEDGRGSGWVARNLRDVDAFDAKTEIAVAIDKAKRSADAKALEPGKYTVILEPAASAGLISFMMFGFDARQADEGRSFLSKKGGGNKLGEKLFDERVTIYADPWDKDSAVFPWDSQNDGLPRGKLDIISKGKVEYLQYSRYWAEQKKKTASAQPGNLIMIGGDKSTMDLVKSTKKGILVTRTWYIRMVDPQTVLLTGLTRDGTFYIEDGEIKYPIKNFRFNESPVIMLNNIEELGKPVRVGDDESPFVMMIPPMKIRDFTFTSLSDAV
ncbi:putative Zn-dependent protease [Tahibacter aquaticus]|jgi:predicted Zn-dependent protease|uniref:Putative Zn-dependent protease n=1 Tax=Tahibacter aquaticus TaxID=520092 RepID=A0A4R6YVA7_9GAMM|nr:TldD/PmbA family protein [Tahibacter aquaticus]TDR42611.1 putative Zn-dependent protease [Tahibacter aquaticus]